MKEFAPSGSKFFHLREVTILNGGGAQLKIFTANFSSLALTREFEYIDWLRSLKQFFINVSYHILAASLTLMALYTCGQSYSDGSVQQSHQSKTGYKYMIWHIDEQLF